MPPSTVLLVNSRPTGSIAVAVDEQIQSASDEFALIR
jgi:hypothetical protein